MNNLYSAKSGEEDEEDGEEENDFMATSFQCKVGHISLDARSQKNDELIFDTGIIHNSSKVNTYCSNSAFTSSDNCSQFVDRDGMEAYIRS